MSAPDEPFEGGKIGAVEAPAIPLNSPQQLADSPTFRAMEDRLSESARIASINGQRSLYHLEQELTAMLSNFTRTHCLKGLMIASTDGLVIAKSEALKHEATLAALASLCDGVGARFRQESILASIDEITLRARDGVRLSIRDFMGFDEPLLLITFSQGTAPRWVTDEVIRECDNLSRRFLSPPPGPAVAAEESARRPTWRRFIQRFLSPLSTSTLFD